MNEKSTEMTQPNMESIYENATIEQLIDEAKKRLAEQDVLSIKDHMDYIHRTVIDELDSEKSERLQAFIADGGNAIDFEYQQPLRDAFYDLYNQYKRLRKEKKQAIEKEQMANFEKKKRIIEDIKALAQAEESIDTTFPAFKKLQYEWREIGNVPRSEMSELYKNYNFYVEAFYDYLQINKELRDLDFKKNQEEKDRLVEDAQNLANEADIVNAMRKLQTLHRKWKEVGPVSPELREPLWDKFSAATKVIHEKRDAYEKELEAISKERIELKKNICEILESIDLEKINSHKQWQKTLTALNEANEKYKQVGFTKHPDNDAVWERFRSINRAFHRAKNAFYKDMKKGQQENLEAKRHLIEKAESLKESNDFKETANQLKKLQQSWKKIGPVPRKDSDAVWEKFRSACDHFFNRMKAFYEEVEKDLNDHYDAKAAILEAFKNESSLDREQLMSYLKKWKDIGQVPRDKRSLEFEWNDLVDKAFSKIDMDKTQSALIRYRAKVEGMMQNDDKTLDKETRFLRQKLDEANRELSQLEENMQRVSGAKDSPFIKEAMKNIRHREEQIALLKKKLSILRELK